MTTADGKAAVSSKTLQFNILAAIAAVSAMFGLDFGLTPEVQAEIVASVTIIGNFLLRFITETKIRSLF